MAQAWACLFPGSPSVARVWACLFPGSPWGPWCYLYETQGQALGGRADPAPRMSVTGRRTVRSHSRPVNSLKPTSGARGQRTQEACGREGPRGIPFWPGSEDRGDQALGVRGAVTQQRESRTCGLEVDRSEVGSWVREEASVATAGGTVVDTGHGQIRWVLPSPSPLSLLGCQARNPSRECRWPRGCTEGHPRAAGMGRCSAGLRLPLSSVSPRLSKPPTEGQTGSPFLGGRRACGRNPA